jgi:hypothetical protein
MVSCEIGSVLDRGNSGARKNRKADMFRWTREKLWPDGHSQRAESKPQPGESSVRSDRGRSPKTCRCSRVGVIFRAIQRRGPARAGPRSGEGRRLVPSVDSGQSRNAPSQKIGSYPDNQAATENPPSTSLALRNRGRGTRRGPGPRACRSCCSFRACRRRTRPGTRAR